MPSHRFNIPLLPRDGENIINVAKLLQKPEFIIDQEDDDDEEIEIIPALGSSISAKRKKKFDPEEEYDLHDDFIDDSDLMYQQIMVNEGEQEKVLEWKYGYFAWRGDVQSFIDEIQEKKSKKIRQRTSMTSTIGMGTQAMASQSPVKKKSPVKKIKKELGKPISGISGVTEKVEIKSDGLVPLHPWVQEKMDLLDQEAKKISWEDKPKQFPQNLKEIAYQAAKISLETKTYNSEHFVKYLTSIVPYNTFTMKKFIGKMVIPEQLELLTKEVDFTYSILREHLEKNIPAPFNREPEYKFKWDEDSRALIWNILCLEWEVAKLDNELNSYQKLAPNFKETSVRKSVYEKLSTFWPSGLMDSSTISKEYSMIRSRVIKLEKRGDLIVDKTVSGIIFRRDPFSKFTKSKSIESETSIQIPQKSLVKSEPICID